MTDLSRLREHEDIKPPYLEKIKNRIQEDGVLKYPIIADMNTGIILDGHHRFNALKQLGCSKIPVFFVDYSSPYILVEGWRDGETITKEDVIRAGLTGKKLPPKTSKHMLSFRISKIAKKVNTPLNKLKR